MRLVWCSRGPFFCSTPRTEVAERKPHLQSNCFALLFLPILELHLVRIACWICREPSKWMLAEWNTAYTHFVLHAAFWWTAINYFRFCLCWKRTKNRRKKTQKLPMINWYLLWHSAPDMQQPANGHLHKWTVIAHSSTCCLHRFVEAMRSVLTYRVARLEEKWKAEWMKWRKSNPTNQRK